MGFTLLGFSLKIRMLLSLLNNTFPPNTNVSDQLDSSAGYTWAPAVHPKPVWSQMGQIWSQAAREHNKGN